MKPVSIIVLALMLTACGQRAPSALPSDADLQNRLVGTWESEKKIGDGGKYSSVIVYRADGSYVEEGALVESNKTYELINEGTFTVRGGVLITTTSNNYPIDRVRIVRFDDRELVGQSEDPHEYGPVTSRRQR